MKDECMEMDQPDFFSFLCLFIFIFLNGRGDTLRKKNLIQDAEYGRLDV